MMMPWRRTSEFISNFRETPTFGVRTDRHQQPASRLRQYNHDYLMQYPQYKRQNSRMTRKSESLYLKLASSSLQFDHHFLPPMNCSAL
jgi:hypothetical protein